jgi:hypothetical protein
MIVLQKSPHLDETLLSLYGSVNCVTVYYFRMYNIRAKKNLSQNFIMDPRLLDRIARDQFASPLLFGVEIYKSLVIVFFI